jgi:hypothetical protein
MSKVTDVPWALETKLAVPGVMLAPPESCACTV